MKIKSKQSSNSVLNKLKNLVSLKKRSSKIVPELQTKTEISFENEDPSLQLIKEMEARKQQSDIKQQKPKTAMEELKEAFAYHGTNYPRTRPVISKMKITAPELETIKENKKPNNFSFPFLKTQKNLSPKPIIQRDELGNFSLIEPSINLPNVRPSRKTTQRTLHPQRKKEDEVPERSNTHHVLVLNPYNGLDKDEKQYMLGSPRALGDNNIQISQTTLSLEQTPVPLTNNNPTKFKTTRELNKMFHEYDQKLQKLKNSTPKNHAPERYNPAFKAVQKTINKTGLDFAIAKSSLNIPLSSKEKKLFDGFIKIHGNIPYNYKIDMAVTEKRLSYIEKSLNILEKNLTLQGVKIQ